MQDLAAVRLPELFEPHALAALEQNPDGAVALRALAETARVLGPDDPRNGKLGLLATTGWRLLLQHSQARPAILLTRMDRELNDHPQMSHLRLTALARSGQHAEYREELARLVIVARGDPALRNALRSLVLSHADVCALLFPLLDDELFNGATGSIAERLATLRADYMPQIVEKTIVDSLAQIRGVPEHEFKGFSDEVNWGRVMAGYFKFVMSGYNHHVIAYGPDDERTRDAKRRSQAVRDAVLIDNTLVQQAARQGQSIFIANLHGGMSAVTDLGIGVPSMPLSIVAAGVPVNAPEPNFHVPADAPDVAMRFLKLAKLLKQGPRLVHIFPDGPFGDMQDAWLIDRPIVVGRGAGVLAWRAKAATFVPRSQWDGSKVTLVLEAGPNAAAYTDGDQFVANFVEFYVGHMRRMILGPAIDMAPNGGFWRFFQ